MRCPFCKEDQDRVVDSRSSTDAASVRRRRLCLACGRRFTTYERLEERPLTVVKKNGSREPFEPHKIYESIRIACRKRPVAVEEIELSTDEIEREINEVYDKEVSSKFIGELVMKKLRKLDQVAYVRFASVYREFRDISDFMEELKPLMGETTGP